MPEHLRSIECCYCGASNLVNLRELKDQTLKCCECGAGMAIDKMTLVAKPMETSRQSPTTAPKPARDADRQLAKEWEGKRKRRDDDDDDDNRKRKKSKKKKKKGLFDRLEDLWDEVEDIFD